MLLEAKNRSYLHEMFIINKSNPTNEKANVKADRKIQNGCDTAKWLFAQNNYAWGHEP